GSDTPRDFTKDRRDIARKEAARRAGAYPRRHQRYSRQVIQTTSTPNTRRVVSSVLVHREVRTIGTGQRPNPAVLSEMVEGKMVCSHHSPPLNPSSGTSVRGDRCPSEDGEDVGASAETTGANSLARLPPARGSHALVGSPVERILHSALASCPSLFKEMVRDEGLQTAVQNLCAAHLIQDDIYAFATQKSRARLRSDILTAVGNASSIMLLLSNLVDTWASRMGPKGVGTKVMETSNLLALAFPRITARAVARTLQGQGMRTATRTLRVASFEDCEKLVRNTRSSNPELALAISLAFLTLARLDSLLLLRVVDVEVSKGSLLIQFPKTKTRPTGFNIRVPPSAPMFPSSLISLSPWA
ncbi:hypothetical protein ADUPG1_001022, partial [Aduncisulcus paluster]